jgi:hypothetical protein
MSLIPKQIPQRIQFYEGHVAPFTTNATAIGITSVAATDLGTKVTAARAAFNARQAAQQAAEAATGALRDAVEAMSVAGAVLIKQIRAKAESVGDNSVWSLAELPIPHSPGPVAAPGTPNTLKALLLPMGQIELSWRCVNPRGCTGVIYQVYRRVSSTGEYAYLGGTGSRKFVDATLPAGVPSVMYQIQATRSTAVGYAAEFTVNFGVTSAGAMTASVSNAQGTPAKIAA